MRKYAVATALSLLAVSAPSLAIDYTGIGSVDYVRADLAKNEKTYDVLVSVGVGVHLSDYFELDMTLSVPNPIVNNDRGVRFGGSVFAGIDFFPDAAITPTIAVGVSGLYGELGCEYVYAGGPGGLPGDSRCLRQKATTAGAGYRVGFKLNDREDRRIVMYFSQLYGRDGLRINSVSIGGQF